MSFTIINALLCQCCASREIFVCCNKNGKHLLNCLTCGLYFFHERPTDEELSNHYRGQYSAQHREQLFRMLKDRYDSGYFKSEAQNHLYYLNTPATKVLDFGSSYAFYLRAMKDLGIDAYGIEYDKDIVSYNWRELGITMVNPEELQRLESNSFDIIRAYHTLEHLPDPRRILSIFLRVLKNNGILLISSPCLSESIVQTNVIRVPDMVYPEHLFYFTTKAISALLTGTGYKVEINMSQFADPSQALTVLGIKGNLETKGLDRVLKGLEEMGAGMNSFAVARKISSSGSAAMNESTGAENALSIYPLYDSRASHHIIEQNGLWKIEFPVKRNSSGGRIFVSGNIIVLYSDSQIRIQLVDPSKNQPHANDSGPFKDNEMKSFVFYNDINGENDYYIRISGTNASEFILYDFNCSEVRKSSLDSVLH